MSNSRAAWPLGACASDSQAYHAVASEPEGNRNEMIESEPWVL